jgi:DNA-binding MarR family transcriptional regulator
MTTDGIDRLGFLIHDSARLLRKRFEAKGSAYGLSAAQWRLLVRLVKEEGVAQARLAELLEIEPISVSRLLDRMEEGGWIERRQDASDRRVRMIFPTEKSREAFAAIKSVAGEVYDQALDGLSADERRTLIKGLNAIVANLSDTDTPTADQSNIPKGSAA